MPTRNVELARQGLDAFNRGDVDSFAALATPDFEWFPALVMIVEGGSYRGREGIEAYFEDIRNTWEELRVVGAEFRDLGDGVLLLGQAQGRGRGSSAPVDAPIGMVADFRGGKVSRVRAYLDHGEALRAAGLSE
jgi:ketosteroid isomerase-like protein